ncbi:MAG: hypothetical protein IBX72_14325 [Nitrospirae bacterium]|jgi:hypothetical protein|nr:hypothetical protein [Nitrospirota bacterium]
MCEKKEDIERAALTRLYSFIYSDKSLWGLFGHLYDSKEFIYLPVPQKIRRYLEIIENVKGITTQTENIKTMIC